MVRDKRYITVKNLIAGGYIKTFIEIFDTLPKSVVCRDLGMNGTRFNNLLEHVDQFVLKDIFRMAALLEVEDKVLMDLVFLQYKQLKKPPAPRGEKQPPRP